MPPAHQLAAHHSAPPRLRVNPGASSVRSYFVSVARFDLVSPLCDRLGAGSKVLSVGRLRRV